MGFLTRNENRFFFMDMIGKLKSCHVELKPKHQLKSLICNLQYAPSFVSKLTVLGFLDGNKPGFQSFLSYLCFAAPVGC